MRNFIDIVAKQLNEGVDFHPATLRKEDGHTYIEYPPDAAHYGSKECEFCDGKGGYHWEKDKKIYDANGTCGYCDGKGTTNEWTYDFPSMRITYMYIELLCNILGEEYDDTGWIPLEDLPDVKRRLIGLINGNVDNMAIPATDEQNTIVDRSGDIPKITKGARMIGSGVSSDMIKDGAQRMLQIIDWAQKHHCGVSWA